MQLPDRLARVRQPSRKVLNIFLDEKKLKAVVVEGDSFHRYDREAMKKAVAESEKDGGRPISHFGPEAKRI